MRYILVLISFISLNLHGMNEHNTKLHFHAIAQNLSMDLLAYADPINIGGYLENWKCLKTDTLNMEAEDITRVIVTARTAQELAQATALKYAKESGLRSSTRVQFTTNTSQPDTKAPTPTANYINAQLNYDKICNHLGIKK